jgi:hypothetical protein
VATEVGRAWSTVQGYERDGWVPDDATRAALARLYDLPESVLFAEYAAHVAADRALLDGGAA